MHSVDHDSTSVHLHVPSSILIINPLSFPLFLPSPLSLFLSPYTQHLLILKQHQEATATLNLTLTLVDQCQGSKAILLKTFYLIIQVTHLLGFGLVRGREGERKRGREGGRKRGRKGSIISYFIYCQVFIHVDEGS